MLDLQFATGLQIVLTLADAERNGVAKMSSAALGKAMGANPSHIRRVVSLLVEGRVLATTKGPKGGIRLARPAAEVSVGDVFGAFQVERGLFSWRYRGVDVGDRVARRMHTAMTTVSAYAGEAIYGRLQELSVNELLESIY